MKSLLLMMGLVGLGYVGFNGVKGDFWDKPLFAQPTPAPALAPAPPVVIVQPAPAAPAPVAYDSPLQKGAYNQTVAVPNPGAINYPRQTVVIVQQQQAPVWKQHQTVVTQRPAGVITQEFMKKRDKDMPLVQSAR